MGSGGGGPCYEEFINMYPASKESIVKNCNIMITIEDNLKRVSYEYDFEIEFVTENSNHNFWSHLIPIPKNDISEISAYNDEGSLRSELVAHNDKLTEAKIFFRKLDKNQIFSPRPSSMTMTEFCHYLMLEKYNTTEPFTQFNNSNLSHFT